MLNNVKIRKILKFLHHKKNGKKNNLDLKFKILFLIKVYNKNIVSVLFFFFKLIKKISFFSKYS